MKRKLFIAALIGITAAACRPEQPDDPVVNPEEITGHNLKDYRVIYAYDDIDDSVTFDMAVNLKKYVKSQLSTDIKVFNDKVAPGAREIIIGRTGREQSLDYYNSKPDDFEWKISFDKDNVVICAGGSWALEYAVNKFRNDYLANGFNYTEGLTDSGTVRGKQLFPRYEGTNLRILDDNVWTYDGANAAAWAAIGEDCTNAVRSRGFAQLIRAYMPDVITFQEFSDKMALALADSLSSYGYSTSRADKNNTPIYYNSATVEMLEEYYHLYGNYTPTGASKISPGQSKSYTINVFRHKATGKQFMAVSTHLWWKSDKDTPGSTECRESEVRSLMAGIDEALGKYNVPVFLAGDMNCKISTSPMKLLTSAGYQSLIDIATDIADGSNGHHPCDSEKFYREYDPRYKVAYNKKEKGINCIDQFFLYNSLTGVKVRAFERIHAYFTIKLTDHYPNYADIAL